MQPSQTQRRSFRAVSKSSRKSTLRVEPLEGRCLPSAALPLDLGSGLDGGELLSDPLFASAPDHHNARARLAALDDRANVPAGNVVAPQTGSTIAGPASAPAGKTMAPTSSPIVLAAPATITVNTLTDENNPGKDATLSLREAIELVNGTLTTVQLSPGELAQVSGTPGAGSLIQFSTGLAGTLALQGGELPALARDVTIQGPGASQITINGLGSTRALETTPGVTATISGLTFADCNNNGVGVSGGAIYNVKAHLAVSQCAFVDNVADYGGAISDSIGSGAVLDVLGCTFTGNAASYWGGAIRGEGDTVTIVDSTFTSNSAKLGGGVFDLGAKALSITGGSFTSNSAISAGGGRGGALCTVSPSSLAVTGTMFLNNRTDDLGGAIYSAACTAASITGCTFASNSAVRGGALWDGTSKAIDISDDTITGNYASNGVVYGKNDAMTVTSTVISNNSAVIAGGISWTASAAGNSLSVSTCSITGNNTKNVGAVLLNNKGYSATFTDCYIGNNYASYTAGALDTHGDALFNYCLITSNTAQTGVGGGVFDDPTGAYTVTLNHCTVSGNKATNGGGTYSLNPGAAGTLVLLNSTVSGNTATTGNGGGCFNAGFILRLVNTTVADNVAAAGKGGGIYETGTGGGTDTQIFDSTIAFNQATAGGGIYTKVGSAGSVGPIYNSIIASNTTVGGTTASDIGGAAVGTAKYDLVGTGGTGGITAVNGNQINVANPMLGSLADNGGSTETIMLLPGSPAINAGSNALIPGGLTTDQRGLTRIVGGTVDIGAVEVQPAGVATHLVTQVAPQVSAGLAFSIGVTVEDDFGTIITGFTGTVTFTSTDSAATLPAAYTFTAADVGHHVFSATLNTLGTQAIFITDAADKLSAVTLTKVVAAPASGAFFIDGINQLWLFQDGKFTNTGAFAKTFSAGLDAEGNPECWFLDGINQLWRYDNGTFTNTGGFALHIAAGKGFVAFSDGIDQLWTFSDGGGGFKNTGGFAARFTAGFDVFGNNQVVFADGINQLWTLNVATGKFTNTGGFTKLFVAGQDAFGNNEIWFTDGNNQIWRLDNGVFQQTPGFALTITGSANGRMFFSDGINQVWQVTDFGVFTNTGAFASHLSGSPGTTALFFSDGIDQLWEFFNGTFTNTGGFATNFSAF